MTAVHCLMEIARQCAELGVTKYHVQNAAMLAALSLFFFLSLFSTAKTGNFVGMLKVQMPVSHPTSSELTFWGWFIQAMLWALPSSLQFHRGPIHYRGKLLQWSTSESLWNKMNAFVHPHPCFRFFDVFNRTQTACGEGAIHGNGDYTFYAYPRKENQLFVSKCRETMQKPIKVREFSPMTHHGIVSTDIKTKPALAR